MRSSFVILALIPSILVAHSGAADTVVKYRYDALGRVIVADQSVTSGSGHTGTYTYDAGGNRAGVDVSKVTRLTWLPSTNQLLLGQSIISADGMFRLTLQRDGNASLFDVRGRQIWSTNTAGLNANKMRMQPDGNLVVSTASGTPLWASNTAGNSGAQLAVQIDGNVVIYQNSSAVWATGPCADCN